MVAAGQNDNFNLYSVSPLLSLEPPYSHFLFLLDLEKASHMGSIFYWNYAEMSFTLEIWTVKKLHLGF